MGLKILKVLCEVEYPDDMIDSEDQTPNGSNMTSPLTEINKIIRDGCGELFTCQKHVEYPLGVKSVFVIQEL